MTEFKTGGHFNPSLIERRKTMISELKEQKLLNAIFGNNSETKSMKFILNLADVEINVSVKRAVKKTKASCSCFKCSSCGGKRK